MKNQFGQPFLQACPPLAQVRNLELLFCDALGVKESSVDSTQSFLEVQPLLCDYGYSCANLLDLSVPLCLQAVAPGSLHAIGDW